MSLKKGSVEGNLITLYRPKSLWERMTYSELLGERRFLRQELGRIRRAAVAVGRIDPRGMWGPELLKVLEDVEAFEKGCVLIIEELQKEMVKRGVGAPERPFT
jgi:hypothetical protein